MNGWSALDIGLDGKAVGASATNAVISKEYGVTAGGAMACAVKVTLSGVTVATGIKAKLQSAIGSDWVDAKDVNVTGNGSVYIKLHYGHADHKDLLPLLNKGRVVLTTGAGDAATVVSVQVLQEL